MDYLFKHIRNPFSAPSLFEDPLGALSKLSQTTSIGDYQTQTEALSNCVMGLPHNFAPQLFYIQVKTTC